MTLKINVRNFRGAERADIEAAPIALVAGLNGAGKSSICQAVAAALSKYAIPFVEATLTPGKYRPKFTKTEARGLVRAGTDAASATVCLGAPANCASVTWPACETETKGDAPSSDVYSTGLLNFTELPEQVRMALLIELLDAAPNEEDFRDAFRAAGFACSPNKELDPDHFDGDVHDEEGGLTALYKEVATALETQGWDGAHRIFAERGAKLKGAWEQITGTKYGKLKAGDWKHPSYKGTAEAPGQNPGDKTVRQILEERIADARQKVENAVAAQAVGDEQLRLLQEQVRELGSVATKLDDAEKTLKQATQLEADMREEYNGIDVPSEPIDCPHCGGSLAIVGDKLEKHDWPKEDIAHIKSQKSLAKANLDKLVEQVRQAQRAVDSLRAEHARLSKAPEQLAAAKAKTGTQEQLDLARDFLTGVEREAEAVLKTIDAGIKHVEIVANQKVIDILAPDGLRRSKLVKACERANKTLKDMSDVASWKTVSIDDELQFRYGGRHYAVLSASEQYRVRAAVHLTVAATQGSKAVIFDGADVLDADGRNGLFALLDEAGKQGIYSVVGMTLDRAQDAPDLAEAKMGQTYWVSDGIARTLAASVKKAA